MSEAKKRPVPCQFQQLRGVKAMSHPANTESVRGIAKGKGRGVKEAEKAGKPVKRLRD